MRTPSGTIRLLLQLIASARFVLWVQLRASIVDFLVRANGREQLVPDDVKTTRLPGALPDSPSKTLERVTDGANGSFIELVQFAKTELGVSHTAAVFDLESCLCVYDGNPRATAGCECSGPCGCDTRGSEVC
jgi:hypothetical protein